MPNAPVIDQLDPFNENKDEFQSKEIRHSRSRTFNRFFINLVNPKDQKLRLRNRLLLSLAALLILFAVLIIIFSPQLTQPRAQSTPEPLVNPTGREATSSDNLPAFDDPETRARTRQELNVVLDLLRAGNDWEYANALFETIFPDYLDACGKYDYYQAAATLADHIANFPISRSDALENVAKLLPECNRE